MPEVTCTTTMALSPAEIWEFVKDMNNWAPFLTGYQKHEILDETDSIWTLKGDVGILSRTVRLRAHVTEWRGPSRVAFTLTGLNEEVEGGGCLEMEASSASLAPTVAAKAGFWSQVMAALARLLFRRMHGKGPKRQLNGQAGPGSRLTFTLRMDAGGPTGPLVNAMLAPALMPAAEDLANKIAAHLEAGRKTG
jgi:carbon monoxide dehydrogenase subunit G